MMKNKKINSRKSKLGLIIRAVVLLTIIGTPVLLLSPEIFSIQYPKFFGLSFNNIKLPLSKVSLEVRLYYLVIAELLSLILAVGLFAVAKILDMFVNKRWFLPDFSKLLTTFGISLIVYTLASWVAEILYTLIAGYEIFKNLKVYKDVNPHFLITFSGSDLLIILIAIVLITVAKVLKTASENANELEQIV